jgi:hypothetical protein
MAKFNTGQSFADGDTVTGAKLNNITSQLNIYTGVISEQAAMSATVSTADQLLIADTDNGDSGAANKITVQKLFDDSLTNGTYTAANLSGTITANRTVATSATITTGTIPTLVSNNATIGTTNGTLGNFTSAAITSGTITTALIPTLTAGTTTGTAGIFTSGTIATLKSTTGTIATLNSTTGTIGNLSTTLAGDFTISSGTGTLGTTAVTAGSYGSVSAIPFITVDAKGRVTAATTGTFSSTPADGSITPAKLSQPMTFATAVASTSGTAIDFTGIPSWAKRVAIIFNGVSTNGASQPLIQIGSGSVTTTGYISGSANVFGTNQCGVSTSTAGFPVNDLSAGNLRYGSFTLMNISGNIWVCNYTLAANSGAVASGGGSVSLSGALDRARITTVNGTDTFDAGSINIMYEG